MWPTGFGDDFPGLIEYSKPLTQPKWRFITLFTARYLRLVVNTIAHWRFKSKPVLKSPTFSYEDVTAILPTISTDVKELRQTIQSILDCNPSQVLLVTTNLCKAIPLVRTRITVMVDDDVTWPNTILPWLLAPFEDEKIGGVGTCQRVKRLETGTLIELCYNRLAAAYIERRNFEISATHYIDGGTSCMSGRTCAFRTEILQDPAFLLGFTTETWRGRLLNADDDNFVTRWLVAKGWKTWVQYNSECEIETTLENNIKFLYQCARWARSNWRSNWRSLFKERHIWRKQPWSTYALHLTMFTNFAIIVDPLLFWSYYESTSSFDKLSKASYWAVFLIWWLTTKNIKLIGLYKRNIRDVWFLPVFILFGYSHSFIKLYAFITLGQTGWGSR
ncbi:hypothetical protein BDZ45DRAFT_709871 [Acephala macrosclerotiorum]|nr:hypothetical protein BDZ45DRAFT_709871 [Acephala macrosclerotiorum]